ncbi:MAG: metallophosphoesterase, partial [Clostridia bacterium]|nr:metallophosphoesterase [Clostridia bacterium]
MYERENEQKVRGGIMMHISRLTKRLTAVLTSMVLLLVVILPVSVAKSASPTSQTLKVMVMSDTHMIVESMIKGTEDYQHAIDRDQKVFNESEAVVDKQLEKVLHARPDVLLLSGDLTKDGEYRGHKALAKKMR